MPPVDPFRFHTSRRSLFNGLSWFFCFWSSFLVFSVICYSALCFHVATSFLCIPIFCPKLGLCLGLLQSLCLFIICPSVSCCFSHIFHLCCCYSSCVSWFNGPFFTTVLTKLEGPVYCIVLYCNVGIVLF